MKKRKSSSGTGSTTSTYSKLETPYPGLIDEKGIPWEIGKILLNEYVVRGILGQGGIGTVYLVECRSPEHNFFAVKTLHRSAISGKNRELSFFRELRIWMDLPDHPHLVSCRFFRTIEDYLAIFSEYVDGGSLAQWIHSGKLKDIALVLDIAIQTAWGLHAAHRLGVIHQDIKPSNILLSSEGTAKITDFGLASMRRNTSSLETEPDTGENSDKMEHAGMTRLYCSPEQASRDTITFKTDIWSWGVTLLEMILGDITWNIGTDAPEILEKLLKGELPGVRLMLPKSLLLVLADCFRIKPEERLPGIDAAAERLRDLYKEITGYDYPRHPPEAVAQTRQTDIPHDRTTLAGSEWDDPIIWLTKALNILGKDIWDLKYSIPERKGSRKVQALVDLQVYELTQKIFARLSELGDITIKRDFAILMLNKAMVHEEIDDYPGAIATLTNAIEQLQYLIKKKKQKDLRGDLGLAYKRKGIALGKSGDQRKAVTYYDSAIAVWEQLMTDEGHSELASYLATMYVNKAIILKNFGDNDTALALYRKAIDMMEQLVYRESRKEFSNELARVYSNAANALGNLGIFKEAAAYHTKAVKLREDLVFNQNHKELENGLAITYFNKGYSLEELGQTQKALTLYNKAIKIWNRLITSEGRKEIATYLAVAYLKKATLKSNLNGHDEAVDLCDHAIEIYESKINKEGRTELVDELARAYMFKALTLHQRGDFPEALRFFDHAVTLWKRVVDQEKREEYRGDLNVTRIYRSGTLMAMGDETTASEELKESLTIVHREMERTKRADFQKTLDWASETFGSRLADL